MELSDEDLLDLEMYLEDVLHFYSQRSSQLRQRPYVKRAEAILDRVRLAYRIQKVEAQRDSTT